MDKGRHYEYRFGARLLECPLLLSYEVIGNRADTILGSTSQTVGKICSHCGSPDCSGLHVLKARY